MQRRHRRVFGVNTVSPKRARSTGVTVNCRSRDRLPVTNGDGSARVDVNHSNIIRRRRITRRNRICISKYLFSEGRTDGNAWACRDILLTGIRETILRLMPFCVIIPRRRVSCARKFYVHRSMIGRGKSIRRRRRWDGLHAKRVRFAFKLR